MAMQSAWLLCEQLVRFPELRQSRASGQRTLREIYRRYCAQWRAQFQPRLRLAACFSHVAMRPVVAARLLSTVRRKPVLLTHAARWSGKTRGLAGLGANS